MYVHSTVYMSILFLTKTDTLCFTVNIQQFIVYNYVDLNCKCTFLYTPNIQIIMMYPEKIYGFCFLTNLTVHCKHNVKSKFIAILFAFNL